MFNGADAAGAATVTDLAAGEDVLRLLGFAVDTAAEAVAAMTQTGGGVVLDLGGGTTVLLSGTTIAQFGEGDFLFA